MGCHRLPEQKKKKKKKNENPNNFNRCLRTFQCFAPNNVIVEQKRMFITLLPNFHIIPTKII